ncbi:formylglycine-generating enzyme family protein [Candidatus Margulisiibacteriota bacterium]
MSGFFTRAGNITDGAFRSARRWTVQKLRPTLDQNKTISKFSSNFSGILTNQTKAAIDNLSNPEINPLSQDHLGAFKKLGKVLNRGLIDGRNYTEAVKEEDFKQPKLTKRYFRKIATLARDLIQTDDVQPILKHSDEGCFFQLTTKFDRQLLDQDIAALNRRPTRKYGIIYYNLKAETNGHRNGGAYRGAPIQDNLDRTGRPAPAQGIVPVQIADNVTMDMVSIPVPSEEAVSQRPDLGYLSRIKKLFRMGKYEVINKEFKVALKDGLYSESHKDCWSDEGWQMKESEGWAEPKHWNNSRFNGDKHPVVGVSYYEAEAFCNWLSKKTGRKFRLASEAEWEYVARGVDGKKYPWGEDFDAAKCTSSAGAEKPNGTKPVDTHEDVESPFGVKDLAGNVWEWLLDHFIRGGAWYNNEPDNLRSACRGGDEPVIRYDGYGFRLVEDLN